MIRLVLSFLLFVVCIVHSYFRVLRLRRGKERDLGLLHPYCNNGGGGERVLWLLISALLHHDVIGNQLKITVYTGDTSIDKAKMIANAENHFGIRIEPELWNRLNFSYIYSRKLLEPKYYPFMTMLFQSLGSVLVTIECLIRFAPDIFCDTTGAAFGYPLAAWIGCRVVAYVHYPIISEDMLQLVRDRRPTYNNDSTIATSISISKVKLVYYQNFASLYSFVGSFASLVMANSSWTCGHIAALWGMVENNDVDGINGAAHQFEQRTGRRLVKVFPPCNTEKWKILPLSLIPSPSSDGPRRRKFVLSVGQFRPEKDHNLQIRAFAKYLKSPVGRSHLDARLVLLGSARNADDEKLVASLKGLAEQLAVSSNVDFVMNAPYTTLQRYLAEAAVGIHTMWNEHFGISVVEMMSAGVVVVAHRSGGPLMDIVVQCAGKPTGFLATTEDEFATAIEQAIDLTSKSSRRMEHEQMQMLARQAADRFSDEVFAQNVIREFIGLLP